MNADIAKILSDHNLRVTEPRKAVFETLKNAVAPLSPREIVTANPVIDKVTVYRTIDVFIALGVVESIAHGWKMRYELAAPFRHHHHHLFCTQCGMVEEIKSDQLEKIVRMLAEQQAFKVTAHTFEITGVCGMCQNMPVDRTV
jgi:Fur family ferric uptake transcriptional regulator